MGFLGAAGVVFFAYIGSTRFRPRREAKIPKRDMPIGILGSLVICTVLYVLFAYVLSGVATVQTSVPRDANVGGFCHHQVHAWLRVAVEIGYGRHLGRLLIGILVMLLGQSRVFFSMCRDGLLPKVFSDIHPRFRTPYMSNILFFVFTGFSRRSFPRTRGRDDQYRDAVCVHSGLHGGLDPAASVRTSSALRVPASRWFRRQAS